MAAANESPLPAAYQRCFRWWFALGWPAFAGVLESSATVAPRARAGGARTNGLLEATTGSDGAVAKCRGPSIVLRLPLLRIHYRGNVAFMAIAQSKVTAQ